MFLPESSHAMSLRKAYFQVEMREDTSDRWPLLGHLIRQGLTPGEADRAVVKLPTKLGRGYYLILPLRLVGKIVLHR
jgi:hypothetical protein